MLSYSLSEAYQTALLKQQAMLTAAAGLHLAAQARGQTRSESQMLRRFRLMFRVRRVLFRVAPRMARLTL